MDYYKFKMIYPKIRNRICFTTQRIAQKHAGKFLGYLDKRSEISSRFPRSTPAGQILQYSYCKIWVYPALAVSILLISGCAPMQITEESNILYDQGVYSKQSIQQKDLEINKLKELLDDQQRQLRELNDQLNECRSKK